MTTGNPAFCLFLYLTGVHFRSKLQHIGDVSEQKIKCSIRSEDIGGRGGGGGVPDCKKYYMLIALE